MATILASTLPLVEATSSPVPWQRAVRDAFRDAKSLLSALGLAGDVAGEVGKVLQAEEQFPLFVPREFAARMQRADPDDPLLRQVLATEAETEPAAGYVMDPVGDGASEVLPGLLQKYRGRALLVSTGACAVHCRYCFRRHYPYSAVPKNPAAWQPAINHIAGDETLEEVILSGGDPLMLSDSSLAWLVGQLNGIPHIQRLRIHTRVPVVIPQRVCTEMLDWVRGSRMQTVLVTHINHPNEIDIDLTAALDRLRAAKVLLLNQAVLLRGINDSTEIQHRLSAKLLACGVLPYYLHQLDRAANVAHFEVPVTKGQQIVAELRAQLSGYGVPKYVSEVAGDSSKRPL